MKNKILVILLSCTTWNVSANAEGDKYICNYCPPISKDDCFHYVFTSQIREGAAVEVTDYVSNYEKIQARVILANDEGFILEANNEEFVLSVNIPEQSGIVEHRGKKTDKMSCKLNGPILLE
jgi:hypothetical protein